MFKVVLFVALFLFNTSSVLATTYWVAATGGTTGGSCAAIDGDSDPGVYFRTIAAGIGCLAGGDTLRVKAGTYDERILSTSIPTGTSSAPTIIQGDSTGLSCTGTIVRQTTGSSVVSFSGSKSWIEIAGICGFSDPPDPNDNNAQAFVSEVGNADITLRNSYFKCTSHVSCVNPGSGAPRFKLQNSTVEGSANGQTCVYLRSTQNTIEHNRVFNCGSNGIIVQSNSFAATDTVVRYNYIHDVGLAEAGCCRGITLQEDNTLVYRNLIIPGGTHSCVKITGGSNGKFIQNTCIGGGDFIHQNAGTGMLVANNIGFGYSQSNFNDAGGTRTFTNNLCKSTCGTNSVVETDSANIFANFAGGNYALSATSVAIAAGSAISGFSCNGTCDLGAFERFTAANAEVGAVSASTIVLNLAMNLHTPAQITNTTGWTSTCGTINGVTAPTATQFRFTLASPYGGGGNCAITYNESTGNARDSSNVGNPNGTFHTQRMSGLASFAVTDNTGGAPSVNRVQSRFRFEQVRGTEAGSVIIASENTSVILPRGAAFRLRLKFRTDDNPVAANYKLRVSPNSGAYADIPDTMGAALIAWYGNNADPDVVAEGTTVTEQLTSDEASNIDCTTVRSSQVIPTLDFNNSETECLFFLQISNSAAEQTTYDFRIEGLETYTVTPRVTVGPYVAGSGF